MSNGVEFYTRREGLIGVNYPNGVECCKWCKLFLRYEENFKRYSCRLTEEWIFDPSKEIGERCPLKQVPINYKKKE